MCRDLNNSPSLHYKRLFESEFKRFQDESLHSCMGGFLLSFGFSLFVSVCFHLLCTLCTLPSHAVSTRPSLSLIG